MRSASLLHVVLLGLAVLPASCGAARPTSTAPAVLPAVAKDARFGIATGEQGPESADQAVAAAAERYVALIVDAYPERATALGLHDADARLDDRTKAGFAASVAREEQMLAELATMTFETPPSPSSALDLEVLTRLLRVSVARKRLLSPLETDPSHYLGPVSALFEMLARPGPTEAAAARAAVERLERMPAQIELAKANLRRPSREATEVARDDAQGVAAFLRSQRPFLKRHGGDPARALRALDGAARAYADYASWLDRVLLPRSTAPFAIGRATFELLLREDYALEEDADAVLAIGQRSFERTKLELEAAALVVDPTEDGWPRVAARLKADHPPRSALVATYQRETARARAFLQARAIVPFPENEVLAVAETPTFARATTQAAYDRPPPLDGMTSNGLFFVTPPEATWSTARQEEYLREHGRGNIVDTVVHEAYPGHHLQVSFARRHRSLVRRLADSDIFCEGWALYSEQLMAEAGFYTPEERLLQLEWRLVRAARVIIDVGLHTGGMSIDEAVTMLVDEVHLEPELARSEARRYALSPTQPLSYVMGETKIRSMRERWFRERGPGIEAFHRALLDEGSIPPALVERAIFGDASTL